MATTTIQPLPYPEPGDSPDVPRDLKALAEAVEGRTVMRFASTAARDAAIPSGQRVPGMHAYIEAESAVYVWTGSAWALIWQDTGQLLIASGAVTVYARRVGKLVEIDITAPALAAGNVTALPGGNIIPTGMRPLGETNGSGRGDAPGVATMPVTAVAYPGGGIAIFKDDRVTQYVSATITYLVA